MNLIFFSLIKLQAYSPISDLSKLLQPIIDGDPKLSRWCERKEQFNMTTRDPNSNPVDTHAVDPRPGDLARIVIVVAARCGSVLMTMACQTLLL
jgi:hypothetical protein